MLQKSISILQWKRNGTTTYGDFVKRESERKSATQSRLQPHLRLEGARVGGQEETLCLQCGPARTRVPLLVESAPAAGAVVLVARVRASGGLLRVAGPQA